MASSGALGAMLGLAFGLAEFVLVSRMIGRALSVEAAQGGALSPQAFAQRARLVRRVMLGAAFVVMPAVGYLVGASIGSETSP